MKGAEMLLELLRRSRPEKYELFLRQPAEEDETANDYYTDSLIEPDINEFDEVWEA